MHFTKKFGISIPEYGWVPAPRYILRRALILEVLAKFPPGRVLEIGSGIGALLYDLARLGFHGIGVEPSVQARCIASKVLSDSGFEICDRLPDNSENLFDYLLSFEVLEHIKDDNEALHKWLGYLKHGGIVLISVPAHKSLWSSSDIWAGHYRRYEREELKSMIEKAGLELISLYSYGWPLSNIIEPIRATIHGHRLKRESELKKEERSLRSGFDRTIEKKLYPLYSNWLGGVIFSFFIFLQRHFINTDLGTGYLLVAQKK